LLGHAQGTQSCVATPFHRAIFPQDPGQRNSSDVIAFQGIGDAGKLARKSPELYRAAIGTLRQKSLANELSCSIIDLRRDEGPKLYLTVRLEFAAPVFVEPWVKAADHDIDAGFGKNFCGCLPENCENILGSIARIKPADARDNRNHADWAPISLQELIHVTDKPSLERTHANRASAAQAPVVLGAVAEPFCESGAWGIARGMTLQPLNQKIAIGDGRI
jgi:hypothetical protein